MLFLWPLVITLISSITSLTHASPTRPSEDPFYSFPKDFQTKPPGTILDHRPLPHPLKDPIPSFYEKAYQIIYRTTDSHDRPTVSLATLLIPPNALSSQILVYFPVQNSACIDCSPSYILADGVPLPGLSDRVIATVHTLVIAGALNQGFIVLVPDYEGFNAAFMANRRGAFAGLDGLRAALASSYFTVVDPSAVAVLMGYSGASPAAVLAAELHDTYAPELRIVGVSVGGLLIHLSQVLEMAIPAPNNLPRALWGLASDYPVMEQVLQEHLVIGDAEKRAEFKRSRGQCAGSLKDNWAEADIASYFDGGLSFLNSSDVRRILEVNSLGQSVPKGIPLLVYESKHDDKSPIEEADALVRRYCEAGVVVDYRRYAMESHTVLSVDGVFAALAWVKERFLGVDMSERKMSDRLSPVGMDTAIFVPEALTGWIDRHIGTQLSLIL
ncbi:uncharacterized protein LDX57_009022 [Aspergillus melleus]|uniref:uncharacterized protein n=1 Tax=Aspergillus melleus TaxID=138277 RepID=UPI001E8ED18D|nr:uncharacterized protein LDX57_009022 [Aspergillus melleus]KAH8431364.1 hypothetical protein LDX57_009022 [Aspergillus melleus]